MTDYTRIFKNDNMILSKRKDKEEFWLYDNTRGMNLAMKSETERDAFVSALGYYQNRLIELEKEFNSLKTKVKNFVDNFVEEEQDFNGDWHTTINI